jgi:transposase
LTEVNLLVLIVLGSGVQQGTIEYGGIGQRCQPITGWRLDGVIRSWKAHPIAKKFPVVDRLSYLHNSLLELALGRARRLSKDYERLPASSEALIYLTCIRLLLARLA